MRELSRRRVVPVGTTALLGLLSACSAPLPFPPDVPIPRETGTELRNRTEFSPCEEDVQCISGVCENGRCGRACTADTQCVPGWQCTTSTPQRQVCSCTRSEEVCDGRDNDCNGAVDEAMDLCGAGQCVSGRCLCADTLCDDHCVDRFSDPQHCGACGNACQPGFACQSGTCVCDTGRTVCDGACIDTQFDAAHCGSCTTTCNNACSFGRCSTVRQIAAGGDHTCVTSAERALYCWGRNDHGESDPDSREPTIWPPRRRAMAPVSTLAIGGSHSCVTTSSSTECWGLDNYFQVTGAQSLRGFTTRGLNAGRLFSCALDFDSLMCWGIHRQGQLGVSLLNDAFRDRVWSIGNVRSAATGPDHACVVGNDSRVYCWGLNHHGQVGVEPGSRDTREPALVPDLPSATEVATGGDHTCALLSGRTVACWGGNAWGQLGDGTRVDRSRFAVIQGLSDVQRMAIGGTASTGFTCALRGDQTVWCWGSNARGQLGIGSSALYQSEPTQIPGLTGVSQLTLGRHHGCAATVDGRAWCWGANDQQQLGDGTRIDRSTPVEVVWR